MEFKEAIKKFILSDIAKNIRDKELDDNESLIESGVFDSLALMKLLTFLEENFEIQISGDELVMENFESLNAISQLVENKLVLK
jgi:acyl carrier protein